MEICPAIVTLVYARFYLMHFTQLSLSPEGFVLKSQHTCIQEWLLELSSVDGESKRMQKRVSQVKNKNSAVLDLALLI